MAEKAEDTTTPMEVESKPEGKTGEDKALFDAPLEVSGKRQRKAVERMEYEEKEKVAFVIPQGPGEEIGNLPNVCYFFDKKKFEELKWIHRMMYGIVAKKTVIRKNIRKFTGFPEDFTEEQKQKRYKVLIAKPIPILKAFAQCCDLEMGGKKQDLLDRIMAFIESPKASGRELQKPAKKGAKKSKKSTKAVAPATSAFTFYAIDKRDEVKEAYPDGSKEELLSACRKMWDGEGDEGQQRYKDMSKTSATKTKKKRKLQPTKAKAKGKVATSKEEVSDEDEEDEEEVVEDDDADSDDEPVAKKSKSGPSKKDIKGAVFKIVGSIEEPTRRMVFDALQEKFPKYDIKLNKEYLKQCIADYAEEEE